MDGGLNNILELGELTNNNYMPNAVDSSPSTNQDDVVIFILDTGLDDNFKNSPYLYDQAPYDNCYSGIESASAYSYIGGSPINSDYIDEVWHGTFGYDVITKEFNPNDNIKVVPLKIFNDQGQGNLFDLTCAIYHAIDHNANIVNISAGYYGQHSSILENAINYARESDVFICTATGNDYDTLTQYPAKFANQYHYIYDDSTQELIDSVRYSNIISVASLDAQNNVSIFSNVGNSTTLFAYGEDIEGMGLQGELLSASGTSMAAFLVSRELALEIANDNTRTYGQIFNDFEANRLVYYDNAEFSSITGKRLDISLTQTNTRLAKPTENQKKIINVYKEDQVTNTAELNTITISNNKMDLIYTTNEAGTLNGKLYGINGRFLATLGEINLQANEQYIIKNAVKQKDNLMGILWLQYKTDNGEIIYSNKKIMFTK